MTPHDRPAKHAGLYALMRGLLGTALGFYFRRIERFHPERVPLTGPVLFASNHPNSLTDAFVIGFSVPRKVNFVATVQLFRFAPFKWLLTQCGVIPVNRVKDDARAMRTVLETFEACFRALERGEAVGIFPEGITHDDPQLKEVKTGAARMALELEHRHAGKLGLKIVPVGLTFSAKERYRSDALVCFGEAIAVSEYLAGYPETRHDCIRRLTWEIQRRISGLILHLPKLERARLVEAVRGLYLDRLRIANRVIHDPVPNGAGELLLAQAIGRAIDYTCDRQPERAAAFTRKLDRYEGLLRRLNLPDEELANLPGQGRALRRCLWLVLVGIFLAPVAIYGWVHRLIPILLIDVALKRFAARAVNRTHVSTTAILAGVLVFGAFYGGCVALFHAFFGFPASLWYGLSLPVASLVAHYYARGWRRFKTAWRWLGLNARANTAASRLLQLRSELISEIESARWEVPEKALTGDPTASQARRDA